MSIAGKKAPDAARGFWRLPVEPGMCPWGAWPILLERRRQEEVKEQLQETRKETTDAHSR